MLKVIIFSHTEHTLVLLCVYKCVQLMCICRQSSISRRMGNCLYKVGKRGNSKSTGQMGHKFGGIKKEQT